MLTGEGGSCIWVNCNLNKKQVIIYKKRALINQESYVLKNRRYRDKWKLLEVKLNWPVERKLNNSVMTEMRTRKEEMCYHSENGIEIKDNPY